VRVGDLERMGNRLRFQALSGRGVGVLSAITLFLSSTECRVQGAPGVNILFVGDGGLHCKQGVASLNVGPDKHPVCRDMERCGFHQPRVPVDARTFIEPAFILTCIDADDQRVCVAVACIVGDIIHELAVAAQVVAEIVPVDPDDTIPKHSLELDGHSFSQIGPGIRNVRRYHPMVVVGNCRPIGLYPWDFTSSFLTFTNSCSTASRVADRSFSRHCREVNFDGADGFAGFGKRSTEAEVEISFWRRCVAEVEFPSAVRERVSRGEAGALSEAFPRGEIAREKVVAQRRAGRRRIG